MVWQANDAELVIGQGDLVIRRLRNEPSDLSLLTRWRSQPHVREWWDPDEAPPTLEQIAPKYGERTHPSSPTTACIIEHQGRPIGYLQFYRWDSFREEVEQMDLRVEPDAYGLDVFIGEPEMVGRGIGPRAIDLTCRYLFEQREATSVALTTEVANTRAQRAYEKAGFAKVREVLELDTRDGERARCWLMTRSA